MKWASAISFERDGQRALGQVSGGVEAALGGPPDLLVMFVTAHHRHLFRRLPVQLRRRFGQAVIVGCSGAGIIGGGFEAEGAPAVSLTGARLPGVRLCAVHVPPPDLPRESDTEAWRQRLQVEGELPHVLMFTHPFDFDVGRCLRGLDRAFPDRAKVGAVASSGPLPTFCTLFLGDRALPSGMVAVAMSGDVEMDTIVAQGCRPVGEVALVTSCEGNRIHTLGGRPAVEVLRATHDALGEDDQEVFARHPFLGLEMRDQREYAPGDFLVRRIVGVDADEGSVAIASPVTRWQAVQFHMRDPALSASALEAELQRYVKASAGRAPAAGALLFSSQGRGRSMYAKSGHDSEMFLAKLGDVALGGLFDDGEISSVRRTAFLHHYTSAFGVFRPRDA